MKWEPVTEWELSSKNINTGQHGRISYRSWCEAEAVRLMRGGVQCKIEQKDYRQGAACRVVRAI